MHLLALLRPWQDLCSISWGLSFVLDAGPLFWDELERVFVVVVFPYSNGKQWPF